MPIADPPRSESPRRDASGFVAGLLGKIAQPRLTVFGRSWSSFRVFGCAGAVVGITVSVAVARFIGLSLWVLMAMSAAALAMTCLQHLLTWKSADSMRMIFYRYELAILIALAGFLWIFNLPVLAYLDVAVVGIGAFLAIGRLGCFMAGCCHGIPHPLGVPYRAIHREYGLEPHFAGVPLVPIQIVESMWGAIVVAAGIATLLRQDSPGMTLSSCVVLYGLGRFYFEFLRGDPSRPYLWGFSEAQWTSLALMLVVAIAELRGSLPLSHWHAAIVVMVGLNILIVAALQAYRGTGAHLLSHPKHVSQLALLIDELSRPREVEPSGVLVGTTSLGINLSMAVAEMGNHPVRLFTLSREGAALAESDCRTLATWLERLNGTQGARWHRRESGAVHIVVPTRWTASQAGDAWT